MSARLYTLLYAHVHENTLLYSCTVYTVQYGTCLDAWMPGTPGILIYYGTPAHCIQYLYICYICVFVYPSLSVQLGTGSIIKLQYFYYRYGTTVQYTVWCEVRNTKTRIFSPVRVYRIYRIVEDKKCLV